MPIYVIDAHALIALEEATASLGEDFLRLLDRMTDLAAAGKLICPPLVIAECRNYADGDRVTSWLRAASGHFNDTSEHWSYMEHVLDGCPSMLDPDDPDENPQVAVLALALYRGESAKTIVVTEEWIDQPGRVSLGNACQKLGTKAIGSTAFIRRVMK